MTSEPFYILLMCQSNLSEQPVRATCQSNLSEQPVRATLSELSPAGLTYFTHNWAMYAIEMDELMSRTHCPSLLCGLGIG